MIDAPGDGPTTEPSALPPDSVPPPQPVEITPPPETENKNDDPTARRRLWVGVIVLVLGLVFLAQQFWGNFWRWDRMWPVVLIVVGLAVLLRRRRS